MILAAGLGTRLRPYTEHTPKALFPLAGRPLIDRAIERLAAAGCEAVIVNTHHLAGRLEAHLRSGDYPIPVSCRREERILGTGGGIRNAADFFDHRPFVVINADVDTDIDPGRLYKVHLSHPHPVTLALTDCPEFNTVCVADDGRVTGFGPPSATGGKKTPLPAGCNGRMRTFTGIQVIDPEVLSRIPEGRFSSIIDAYQGLIASGRTVMGHPASGRWTDIGAPERYLRAALDRAAPEAFSRAFSTPAAGPVHRQQLAGDGSQRRWYRLWSSGRSLIAAVHGIRRGESTEEVDAFVDIGRHLRAVGVPVPEIHDADRFSGIVFVEDLGDTHLEEAVKNRSDAERFDLYRRVVDLALHMGLAAVDGFRPHWAWQTPRYDRQVILENECRYFCEAFVAGHLGRPDPFSGLFQEFSRLAERIESFSVEGFMHRDFQSRNIMVRGGEIFFIDFQGGRIGPLQYDLASMIIDPYVDLSGEIRQRLVDHAARRLSARTGAAPGRCLSGIRYCALSRNLQALGAFGHLTASGKGWFADAIPSAVRGLRRVLAALPGEEFPGLARLAEEIQTAEGKGKRS